MSMPFVREIYSEIRGEGIVEADGHYPVEGLQFTHGHAYVLIRAGGKGATVTVERSFDDGASWEPFAYFYGQPNAKALIIEKPQRLRVAVHAFKEAFPLILEPRQ